MTLKLFRTPELEITVLKVSLITLLKIVIMVEKVEIQGIISLWSLLLTSLRVPRQWRRKDRE